MYTECTLLFSSAQAYFAKTEDKRRRLVKLMRWTKSQEVQSLFFNTRIKRRPSSNPLLPTCNPKQNKTKVQHTIINRNIILLPKILRLITSKVTHRMLKIRMQKCQIIAGNGIICTCLEISCGMQTKEYDLNTMKTTG